MYHRVWVCPPLSAGAHPAAMHLQWSHSDRATANSRMERPRSFLIGLVHIFLVL